MLIAYYRLNNNLNDEMKQYNLSYVANSGAIVPASGVLGGGYQRPSVNNGSDMFTTTKNVFLSGSHSYSCWALVSGVVASTANGIITNHDHTNNTGSGITIRYISDTDFRISCNTGNGTSRTFHTYFGTTNIKDKWSHLVFTYDAKLQVIKLWVNGVLELTQPYNMKTKPDLIQLFSWSVSSPGNNYRPACILDEVRVYNHCLSTKEISELFLLKSLHLSGNSLVVDHLGKNLLTSTLVSLHSDTPAGVNYIQFNGSSLIEVNNHESVIGNMSVEFWLYPENIPSGTRQTIFNKGYGSEGAINITDGRLIQFYTGNGNGNTSTYSSVQSVSALPLSQWTHVIVVRDINASQLRIYINGALNATAVNNYIPQASTIPLTIGSGYTTGVVGRIANLVVYGSAISNEVAIHLYKNRGSLDSNGNLFSFNIDTTVGFNEDWDYPVSYPLTRTNVVSTTGSVVRVTSHTSIDPWIDMPNLGVFDPLIYKFIQVRYRVISGSPTQAEIYFYNSLYTSANAAQHVVSPLVSDGAWNIASFNMSSHSNWTHSSVTGWRFDWCNLINVTMEIDYIRLVKDIKTHTISKSGQLQTNQLSEIGVVQGSALQLYIPLEGEVVDYSLNRLNLISTAINFESNSYNGKGSAVFNGSTSSIEIPMTAVPSTLTFSVWVYYQGTAATSSIISKGTTSYEIFINSSNRVVFTAGTTTMISNTILPTNSWTHICVVYTNDIGQIFVNGVFDIQSSLTFSSNSQSFFIGRRSGGSNFFNGYISDLRIYAAPLSQTDISSLFIQSGNSTKLASRINRLDIIGNLNENIV